jgi:hypothetical protein
VTAASLLADPVLSLLFGALTCGLLIGILLTFFRLR